jgi:hypothetical protein
LMMNLPKVAYQHLIEANRAWVLLALGRIDDAAQAVATFSEVPVGSSWEHLNLIMSHMVMAHAVGLDEAIHSFASEAKELVARTPQVRSTVLQGFAYLAHLRDDEQRAQEITSMTLPLHGEQLWNWIVLRPLGATAENFVEVRAAYEEQHPLLERFTLDAEHSQRLFAEEIERWA